MLCDDCINRYICIFNANTKHNECGLYKPEIKIEIVRCKNCKHWEDELWCNKLERGTNENFYCAYGEKRK